MIKLNSTLFGNIDRKNFISLIYSIIDVNNGMMVFSRAGHTPLLHYSTKTDSCVFYKSPGIGLGLDNGKVFNKIIEEQTVQLLPGDILVFYTDGITETFNKKGQEFGEDKLLDALYINKLLSPTQIKEAIFSEVSDFMGNVRRFDDMTVVVAKIK